MKLEIFNYGKVSSDIDFKGITSSQITKAVTEAFPESEIVLNIIFVDREEIRTLNKEFRQNDSATDVLSFEAAESEEFGTSGINEVYVCGEYILDVIKASSCTADMVNQRLFLAEVLRMIIHGILHISGYDHEGYFQGGFAVDINGSKDKMNMKLEEMYSVQEKLLTEIYTKLMS